MQIQPYLSFEGRCEEAIEFYRKALGAEVTLMMRFKDNPEPPPPGTMPPGMENKIMHASVRIGETITGMTDGHCQGASKFSGITLSIVTKSEAEAEKVFAAVSDGGKVNMPLTKTFFSPRFGMLNDRFGVSWMVLVQ